MVLAEARVYARKNKYPLKEWRGLSTMERDGVKFYAAGAWILGKIRSEREIQMVLLDEFNIFINKKMVHEWAANFGIAGYTRVAALRGLFDIDPSDVQTELPPFAAATKNLALTPETAARVSTQVILSVEKAATTAQQICEEIQRRLAENPDGINARDLAFLLRSVRVGVDEIANLTILVNESELLSAKHGENQGGSDPFGDAWREPVRGELAVGEPSGGADGADGET